MRAVSIKTKKRIRWILIGAISLMVALIAHIAYIQFIQGSDLQKKAYEQQSLERAVNPKRGTIYDATGNVVLAISSSAETVTVNPTNIAKENKEKVARALSDILETDYEKVLKRVKRNSSIETIAKKQEKEKTDKLRIWMNENDITEGINIDEDTKRYYPYNNLAAQFIGFCGGDNQGLDGIEAKFDNILKGKAGKIERISDATGGNLSESKEEYIPAEDGNSIVLSLDMTIQSIAEKYLENACIDNVCTDGGNIVIMNPKTGDVLAMATYPDYNLNEPFEPTIQEDIDNWGNLDEAEKNKRLQAVWRNKAISDTYEPGSTFKLITASTALEEGIVTDIDRQGEFCCTGSITIAGARIKCWRYYRPHGSESLRQGLMNSCNPVFIGLGQKIGVSKYYEYLSKFGLLEKTGIELPGEAKSIFLAENKMGPVELATVSFGQRFEITPIQLVTAVSSIANGGYKIQPRVVKQVIDSKTGEKTDLEIKKGNQILSKETSEKMLSMMQSVVDEGTGKNAQVVGYTVGGKTGTSEDGVNTGKYVTSFLGVAPITDPQVVILVTLYNPTGEGGHQGGGIAAPVGGQVLSEVLPYLELQKDKEIETEEEIFDVTVPELRGVTIKEAKEKLKEYKMELEINNLEENQEIDETQTIIKEQLPKPGIVVKNTNKIYVEI